MAAVVCGAAEFFFVLVVCPGKGGVGDLEARVFAVVADSFLSVDVLSRAGRNVMGDDRAVSRIVRKTKSAEKTEKFERKKTGARTSARYVSWESCQLAAHTRVGRMVGRSVGREDRPPQWPVGRCS